VFAGEADYGMQRAVTFLRLTKLFFAIAVFCALPHPACGQAADQSKILSPGKLLVARRDAPDPRFARTVILLVKHDETGAMGVIINRPTKFPLSQVLDGVRGGKNRQDPAYLGGPVETESVLAIVRSQQKLADGLQVLPDVFVIASKAAVQKALAGKPDSGSFRAFMGYSGWGPKQLEHELDLDAWVVMKGSAAIVFAPEPETVWPRLIQRAEAQIARYFSPGLGLKSRGIFGKIGL
jgi:putative transcriptional regulator